MCFLLWEKWGVRLWCKDLLKTLQEMVFRVPLFGACSVWSVCSLCLLLMPSHRASIPGHLRERKDLGVCKADERERAHPPRILLVFSPPLVCSSMVVPMHLHPNSFRTQPADYINGCSVLKYAWDDVCEIIEIYLSKLREGR